MGRTPRFKLCARIQPPAARSNSTSTPHIHRHTIHPETPALGACSGNLARSTGCDVAPGSLNKTAAGGATLTTIGSRRKSPAAVNTNATGIANITKLAAAYRSRADAGVMVLTIHNNSASNEPCHKKCSSARPNACTAGYASRVSALICYLARDP
jgi:hypothetical protein